MQATKLISTFLFLVCFKSSFAQDIKVIVKEYESKKNYDVEVGNEKIGDHSLYCRIGIYEATLGFSKKLNYRVGLGIEADYRVRLRSEAPRSSQVWLMNPTYSGYRVKLMLNLYDNEENNPMSVVGSYRYLKSGNIIYGHGPLAGTNASDNGEYSDKNHEIAIGIFLNK